MQTGLNEKQRRAAYAADVTYVTNSELGFDYLRDNLAQVGRGRVQFDCKCNIWLDAREGGVWGLGGASPTASWDFD